MMRYILTRLPPPPADGILRSGGIFTTYMTFIDICEEFTTFCVTNSYEKKIIVFIHFLVIVYLHACVGLMALPTMMISIGIGMDY